MTRRRFSPEEEREIAAEAKALIDQGWAKTRVAAHLGVSEFWLRCQTIRGYREDHNEKTRIARSFETYHHAERDPLTNDQLRDVRASIPKDTRDFTARIFGDPLPGRSALDQKRQSGELA